MNSFIGWIGGKRALRNEILQRMPSGMHYGFNSATEMKGHPVVYSSDKLVAERNNGILAER